MALESPALTARLLPSAWWQLPLPQLARLAPFEPLVLPAFTAANIQVDIKREDLLCPFLGGNKLYKLYFHLQRAQQLKAHTLISFGGAYSNHLYALAKAGAELGLVTRAFVRGEPATHLSPTLIDAQNLGMQLTFIDRTEYRQKHSNNFALRHGLYPAGVYVIPEGGGDLRGALGMARYAQEALVQQGHYDAVIMAAGTGASLAGLMVAACATQTAVHGILVLKGSANAYDDFARHALRQMTALQRLTSLQAKPANASCWQLHTDFHGGHYGPANGLMAADIAQVTVQTNIAFDPVYTGKVVLAAQALAEQGAWPCGSRILMIHSGGLQGARSIF
ncbi:MAG: pyridoxal-phosphate dependent enzyme [Marinagarivorans sp.]|nr:pyridoxal-phosphate dependent enzyme [Marinagarivorans sp.]